MPEFGEQVFASGLLRGTFAAAVLLSASLALYVFKRIDDSKPIRLPTAAALTSCLIVALTSGFMLAWPDIQRRYFPDRREEPNATIGSTTSPAPPRPTATVSADAPKPPKRRAETKATQKPSTNTASTPDHALYSVEWANTSGHQDAQFFHDADSTMTKCWKEAEATSGAGDGIFTTMSAAQAAAKIANQCAGRGFGLLAIAYRNTSLESSRAAHPEPPN